MKSKLCSRVFVDVIPDDSEKWAIIIFPIKFQTLNYTND